MGISWTPLTGEQRVLVGGGHDLEFLRSTVVALRDGLPRQLPTDFAQLPGNTNQPAPPGTLEGGSLSIKSLLEVFNGAKILLKSRLELAVRKLTAAVRCWGQNFPEERVVDVT